MDDIILASTHPRHGRKGARMDDIISASTQMDDLSDVDKAKKVLHYILNRIREDEDVGYDLGPGTHAFALLTEVAAALYGQPLLDVRKHFSVSHLYPSAREQLIKITQAWHEYSGRKERFWDCVGSIINNQVKGKK